MTTKTTKKSPIDLIDAVLNPLLSPYIGTDRTLSATMSLFHALNSAGWLKRKTK